MYIERDDWNSEPGRRCSYNYYGPKFVIRLSDGCSVVFSLDIKYMVLYTSL